MDSKEGKLMMARKITVIGSINMDLVIKASRMPKPGESLFAQSFKMIPGGKGANQAVAVAKLGEKLHLVGKVGRDVFGEKLLKGLEGLGVNTNYVFKDATALTGVAFIMVDAEGQNSILIANGANGNLSPEDIKKAKAIIENSDLVLLQLEIPLKTVGYAVELANEHKIPVVLDAGPPPKSFPEFLTKVDILSPNELEAETLTGVKIKDLKSAKVAAQKLLNAGVKKVVLKLGADGALLATSDGIKHIKGIKVHPVDTTAAGDAFTAGLAVSYAQGKTLEEAAVFANYVGALTVTKFGAQPSIPSMDEVKLFIKETKA
ncbi:MAG: ribokinase [Candidatus Aerophobetes bacterium]|nr:ribokinase [Candidatus Aerophobetes bacterium]